MSTIALPWLGSYPVPATSDPSVTQILTEPTDSAETPELLGASVSLDEAFRGTAYSLAAIAEDAGEDDWDGFGARAVTSSTVEKARAFLRNLPSTVEMPEVSAHPDGELSFYWARGPQNTLVVSVSSAGRLSFASLHGQRHLYGTEYLVNGLPSSIEFALRRLHSGEG